MAADPLDRIAEICHDQPHDALSQIAAVLGFDEQSPGFTDTARAALLWVLWHHQGGSSPTGQAVRFALGMGQFDRLTAYHVVQAKTWAPGIPGLAHTDPAGVEGRKP